jgi:mannose-6-phosphate isomerase class I
MLDDEVMDLKPPTGYRSYDPDPQTATGIQAVTTDQAGGGYQTLASAVGKRLTQRRHARQTRPVVCFDLYHSPDMDVLLAQFRTAWEIAYGPATWIDTRTALKEPEVLAQELQEFLTEDPVFGRACDRDLTLFFDPGRWQALVETVQTALQPADSGPLFITGPGALLSPLRLYSDVALYGAVPRETVFFASESGIGRNLGDDQDRGRWPRYKRSFYIDWPVQDRHFFAALPACDFLIDMHDTATPAFVDIQLFLDGMAYAAERPFRVRSLFMPGVWGGRRLQDLIPGLPPEWPNCAWGFEVVAPENGMTFAFSDAALRVPFHLFMHFQAARILGPENHRRFGDFFPIRFDFLDTMDGTNLSLQVHPPDAYINAHFREPFAQHETYYILETRPGAKVYLGLQEATNREAFLNDVARAQSQHIPFEITNHVNAWDAAQGDLFIIPAGTVHCSGANNLVLEISATPYIYTFKIYDYLRPDLDGRPRPISYERAFEVIDFSRKTDWVRQNLLAKPRCLAEGRGWRRMLLTDSALMFHHVERIEMTASYADSTQFDGVHVLCVVEGQGVRVVREADGTALELSYAETVIVPGACGPYRLEPLGNAEVKVVKSYVRA